jgi:hypothetical protein
VSPADEEPTGVMMQIANDLSVGLRDSRYDPVPSVQPNLLPTPWASLPKKIGAGASSGEMTVFALIALLRLLAAVTARNESQE